jgi:hypothetical protein
MTEYPAGARRFWLFPERRIVGFSLRPLPLLRQGMLRLFGCCATFSARPSQPNQEGPRADSWTREAERCTGVTNAVIGEADGAPC